MSLEERVRGELLIVRKSSDGLTVGTVAESAVITGLLGNGDPRIAYNTLKHLILSVEADTGLTAAMYSLGLLSKQETHLGRLEDFGAEHGYEQRQVRRYSDKGVRQIADMICGRATESVPTLDVYSYQVGTNKFAFQARTKCQYFIDMRPLSLKVRIGTGDLIEIELSMTEPVVDNIWDVGNLKAPYEIDVREETSLTWSWRGELWPKFTAWWRTDVQGFAVATESIGNKMMLRMLPGSHESAGPANEPDQSSESQTGSSDALDARNAST